MSTGTDGSGLLGVSPGAAGWSGQGVRPGEVVRRLGELLARHQGVDQRHAVTRTLNLIIVPETPDSPTLSEYLATMGRRSPARTLVLLEHREPRLDAEVVLDCQEPPRRATAGACHDRITMYADRQRLEHADSLVTGLLALDLPTVTWLPDPGSGPADAALASISGRLLLDSDRSDWRQALERVTRLGRLTTINDLCWRRLAPWRAQVAAAFDATERREMLPLVDHLEVRGARHSPAPALLLAGWVAARLNWRVRGLRDEEDGLRLAAARPDGGAVDLFVGPAPNIPASGGIDRMLFRAGDEQVCLDRGAMSDRAIDALGEALGSPGFFAGYNAAMTALEPVLP